MPGVNLDGQSRADEEIELDDGSFMGATLTRCVLVYRGGRFPNLKGVRIIEPQWAFKDAAKQTIGMLAIIGLDWPDLVSDLIARAQRELTRQVGN